MVRRIFLFLLLFPVLLCAQNGTTVFPMPGFFNPVSLKNKNCISTDHSGKVWIGTRYIGAIIWDGSAWNYFDSNNGLSDNNIRCITADTAGYVWLGTDTGGVCKYDGFGWLNYSSWNSPLPSSHINSIAVNGAETWIGTNRGLAMFDGINWMVYTTQNSALPGDTVNDIAVAPNGELLIACSRGLIHYSGSSLTGLWQNPLNPVIQKSYVHTDGTEWIISDYVLYKNVNGNFVPIDQIFDLPWTSMNTSVGSVGKGPNGGIAFCTDRGAMHEIQSAHLQTYYPHGMVVSNTISYGLFAASQVNNEFWFVNSFTTSLNPPTIALMRFDASGYNGLGLGATGMNGRNIDVNQVDARLLNRGDMFWDLSAAQYVVPASTGATSIFAAALWIGGLDSSGILHEAAATYRQRGFDYFPGTIDPQTTQTDSVNAWKFDRIWKVNKYMISEFQWNFAQGNVQNGTYLPDSDILDWPAIGNWGITEPLASFVDVNGNGIYDPLAGGDYPLIKGDEELFCVFNDLLAPHTETGALPLGIEVQRHTWANVCNAASDSTKAINYTVFISYDIINRSQNNYHNLMLGSWVEPDLGNWQDDHVGCNPQLNAAYVYNGDSIDDYLPPYTTYLNFPPVQSTVVLDGPEALPFDSVDNDNDGITDEPGEKILLSGYGGFNWMQSVYPWSSPVNQYNFYSYLNSQWEDSSAFTYGGNGHTGNLPYAFMYPDIPSDTIGWNEFTGGNVPGDRTTLLSTGKVNFNSGDTIHYTVAHVTSFDSLNAWNTPAYYQHAFNDIRNVQAWYAANNYPTCFPLFDAVPEMNAAQPKSILLFPNPANDQLTIEYKATNANASIYVYDLSGKNLFSGKWNSDRLTIPLQEYNPGFYFVQIVDGNQTVNAKFIRSGN